MGWFYILIFFVELFGFRIEIVLMEEQKLSILQRNKINYILRSGEPLPKSKPLRKATTTNCFPAPDLLRAKNAKRRTLDAIKASGGYDRAKYRSFLFLSIAIDF